MATSIILAILATYRIARMLAMEEGAFEIFSKIRKYLGGDEQDTWIGRGINCPLCCGMYVALVFALIIHPSLDLNLFLIWLAIAGGQTFLQKMEK